MKRFAVMALVCVAALLGAAEKNLLSGKWGIYGTKNAGQKTVIQKNGQIDCCVTNAKTGMAGVVQGIHFPKKPLTGSITFGAESKAENVKKTAAGNYCVYLDLTFTDGKRLFGQIAPFKSGTHDWTKSVKTIKLPKPVKSVAFYVLFRKTTGKVSFRNIFFYNK